MRRPTRFTHTHPERLAASVAGVEVRNEAGDVIGVIEAVAASRFGMAVRVRLKTGESFVELVS